MNEMIKVNYDNDRQTISGRDLHDFLEVETRYNDWFLRMCEYGFSEEIDFYSFLSKTSEAGGRPSVDHKITIDMAKEIAMLQRTEKGKQARQYFIELEKCWNSPEAIMARALKMADVKILEAQTQMLQLEEKIEEMKPKADFFDAVADSKDAIDIGSAAKILNMGVGRNTLFEELRRNGVLMENNQPYQKYIDSGYFRTIEQKYVKPDGSTCISIKTLVYQRGLDFIKKSIAKNLA